MKIAVTTFGSDLDGPVDPRFGRAQRLLVVDLPEGATDLGSVQISEVLDNERTQMLTQGAGLQAAQKIVDAGARALVTGHCGPKAFQVLSLAEVRVYQGASGSVRDALTAFVEGRLEVAREADVEGHW